MPAPIPLEPLLSAQEAARLLGVSRSFITVHASEIGAVKVGKKLRVPPAALRAYLERQRVVGAAPEPEPVPIRRPARRVLGRTASDGYARFWGRVR